MAFVEDVSRDDVEQGGVSVAVEVDGEPRRVAVYVVDGEPRGFADVCPHAGAPLSEGGVRDGVLRCPRHGAAFDVESGEPTDQPSNPASRPLELYDVGFVDGGVELTPQADSG